MHASESAPRAHAAKSSVFHVHELSTTMQQPRELASFQAVATEHSWKESSVWGLTGWQSEGKTTIKSTYGKKLEIRKENSRLNTYMIAGMRWLHPVDSNHVLCSSRSSRSQAWCDRPVMSGDHFRYAYRSMHHAYLMHTPTSKLTASLSLIEIKPSPSKVLTRSRWPQYELNIPIVTAR